jgi:hypothetical protein
LVVGSLALAFVLAHGTKAQAQEGAFMMVLIDTSSSMLADVDGYLTYGDGSVRYPGDTSSTGDSRLYIAKEVVTDVVSGAGTIRFGLARYASDTHDRFGIPDDNDGDVCPFYAGNRASEGADGEYAAGTTTCGSVDYDDVDYISAAGWSSRGWVQDQDDNWGIACCQDVRSGGVWNGVCETCTGSDCRSYDFDDDGTTDYTGVNGATIELDPGADILVTYDADTAWDPYSVLDWVDGVETWDSGGEYTNPELRASGFTPLARSMVDIRDHFAADVPGGVIPTSGVTGITPPCYRYAVILTDGEDTCEDTDNRIVQAATLLWNEGITTYVIAFAISSATLLSTLDDAAVAGGTYRAKRANDRHSLRAAFAEIVQEASHVEECNNIDDDCDGVIDEDLYRPCSGACRDGQQQCSAGEWGACDADDGSAEVCDGEDNDCDPTTADGSEDPDLNNQCEAETGVGNTGACEYGHLECIAGALTCMGAVGPSREICDGIDNDCDASTADGSDDPLLGQACGTVGLWCEGVYECNGGNLECSNGDPSTEVCDDVDNDCDGSTDEHLNQDCSITNSHGTCTGREHCEAGDWVDCTAQTPTAEVCNNRDDNCNDEIDEDLTRECETACETGTQTCINGQWGWDDGSGWTAGACSAQVPVSEICDTIDNDCDDRNNEGLTRECGDASLCGVGYEICDESGNWVNCNAPMPEPEICDTQDNDCDPSTPDGIDDPEYGQTCENDCGPGNWECREGDWVCVSTIMPAEEVCDGVDNDCDGVVDETDPELNTPCEAAEGVGAIGQCEYGRRVCDQVDGVVQLICVGAIGPSDEICDCEDNDCDGEVDEEEDIPGAGDECGHSDVPPCQLGTMVCAPHLCAMECQGAINPQPEECDGIDGDCDGIDDEVLGEAPCPVDEARCIAGECALPCRDSEFPCPPGKYCGATRQNAEGEDVGYCISDNCADVSCAPCQQCQPETGNCVDICDDIECTGSGMVCSCGRCVPDNCYHLGCDEGSVCLDNECVADPCATVTCGTNQFCRNGECVGLCTGDIVCNNGERCVDGRCVEDRCFEADCPAIETCDPTTGLCTTACASVRCQPGQQCNPTTGECMDDPCTLVTCPTNATCVDGTCLTDDIAEEGARRSRLVLVTGAGGLACHVAGAGSGESPSGPGQGHGGWALFLSLMLVWQGIARRGRRGDR